MTIVFVMSTDEDIVGTKLHTDWGSVSKTFSWEEISERRHNVSEGEVIVVVAHGNNEQIGNAEGDPGINAACFVQLVQANMAPDAKPSAIYISTCGKDIAGYAASVRLYAEENELLGGTRLLGHDSSVAGEVPSPHLKGSTWVEIFEGRTRG